MNFSDLFIVIVLASALYGLVVALTRQRHFLAKAVNPHRATWLVAAASTFWLGVSLLRWEASSWDLSTFAALLSQLVTEAPTPARVKVASMALFLGIVFFGVVVWCTAFLPRDPSTFRRPEHRKAAFRYYVTKLRGGLDYALLGCGDGERLEEAAHVQQIQLRCPYLPKVQGVDGAPARERTVDDQLQFWRETALVIHQRMPELDSLIEHAHHGRNRRLIFDAEYGGFFFKYLRTPDPRSKVDTGLYLFGATVNQTAMDNQTAAGQFRLLVEALEHIDRSIRVG